MFIVSVLKEPQVVLEGAGAVLLIKQQQTTIFVGFLALVQVLSVMEKHKHSRLEVGESHILSCVRGSGIHMIGVESNSVEMLGFETDSLRLFQDTKL